MSKKVLFTFFNESFYDDGTSVTDDPQLTKAWWRWNPELQGLEFSLEYPEKPSKWKGWASPFMGEAAAEAYKVAVAKRVLE